MSTITQPLNPSGSPLPPFQQDRNWIAAEIRSNCNRQWLRRWRLRFRWIPTELRAPATRPLASAKRLNFGRDPTGIQLRFGQTRDPAELRIRSDSSRITVGIRWLSGRILAESQPKFGGYQAGVRVWPDRDGNPVAIAAEVGVRPDRGRSPVGSQPESKSDRIAIGVRSDCYRSPIGLQPESESNRMAIKIWPEFGC